MEKKRYHVVVEGRVQGVFFRACTQEEALRLNLTGWVRNRPEGTVEALIEGESEQVEKMVQWFYKGSPGSLVSQVKLTEEEHLGENTGFEIHYY